MGVALRWKTYKNGTKQAYIDIYIDKNNRKREFLDVRIAKNEKVTEKKKLAEKIKNQREREIIHNKYNLIDEKKSDSCFLIYCQTFLEGYTKASKRKYRYSYDKFLDYLLDKGIISKINHGKTLHEITTANKRLPFKNLNFNLAQGFWDYLTSSKSGLSGETPYDYFKRIRSILNRAEKSNYIVKNPFNEVSINKPKNRLSKQILSIEELQKLASTECGNNQVKKAFLFACYTGLGYAELKKLKWSQIDNNRLITQRAKNENPVSFQLSPFALKLIGKPKGRNELIFNLPSDTTMNNTIDRWVKKAEIDKHITTYCARHSFAVINLINGQNLKTISKLMGHSSTVPTNVYLNYLEEEKDKAMESMPQIEMDI